MLPNPHFLCIITFVTANISSNNYPEQEISKFFTLIGQSARIKILWVIAEEEACVCHLETALEMRQASISQHLMVLRKAGLVSFHRDGRNVYYRLVRPEIVGVLEQAAQLAGNDPESLRSLITRPIQNCPCPQCNPDYDQKMTCDNLKSTIPL